MLAQFPWACAPGQRMREMGRFPAQKKFHAGNKAMNFMAKNQAYFQNHARNKAAQNQYIPHGIREIYPTRHQGKKIFPPKKWQKTAKNHFEKPASLMRFTTI
jgi:hypothetical protein